MSQHPINGPDRETTPAPRTCFRCDYSLKGLPDTARCPECGAGHAASTAVWRSPAWPHAGLALCFSFQALLKYVSFRAAIRPGVVVLMPGYPPVSQIDLGQAEWSAWTMSFYSLAAVFMLFEINRRVHVALHDWGLSLSKRGTTTRFEWQAIRTIKHGLFRDSVVPYEGRPIKFGRPMYGATYYGLRDEAEARLARFQAEHATTPPALPATPPQV